MRRLLMLMALTATPAVAGPVNSYGNLTLPPGVVKTAANEPNKVMCVTEDTTGSRLQSVRTCHSAAEWLQIRQQAQTMLPMMSQQQIQCPSGGHCAN